MKSKKTKISYEPEADVLTLELNKKSIDHASEFDNIIVHFTKNDQPVLLEVLEASKFFQQTQGLITKQKVPA
jgi:uncharacterized protein YuzE